MISITTKTIFELKSHNLWRCLISHFSPILLVLALTTVNAHAVSYQTISLPPTSLNVNLTTWTNGSVYSGLFSGTQTLGGIPFALATNSSGYDVFWGSNLTPSTLSGNSTGTLSLSTNNYGAITVYTLINSAWGTANQKTGSLTFTASNGDSYTVQLVEGVNVRDHYYGSYIDTLSASYVTQSVIGTNNSGTAHLDMQAFDLPNSFMSETLTSIVFTSTGSASVGLPFLAGITVATASTPLADYRMDETSWSGVSGEINDNSANKLDGTAKGGTTTTSGKICNGGLFNGSSNYAQIPDNSLLRLTGSYTIAAWVKTSVVGTNTIVSKDGTGSPWFGYEYAAGSGTGAGKEAAWLGSGSWVTSNGTAIGNSSWHHVTMTVNGTSLQFYLDGVANGTAATTSGATTYSTTALLIGLNSDFTLGARFFNGQMDELKLWNTALSATEIQTGYSNEAGGNNWDGSVRTCPTIVASTPPSSFNAFDSTTAANTVTGYIQTKIAGTAFSFDVVALTIAPSVLTSFNSTVKVELVDATTSSSCSTMTPLQTVTSSYSFVSSDTGRHTFSGITQAQAYPNVKVRISYPATSPTTVVCSTDAFAIRPNNFVVAATDATWSTAGSTRTLNASTATGTTIHKAGQPLTLTVTPYNSSGSVVTSTYTGTPVTTATCALPTTNCVSGAFSTGAFTFNGGIATSNTATYSDVGSVNLTLSDATFASIDASDGTPNSQLTISSSAITVGRFVPDHFDATLNSPVFTPGCTTFTYMGQPIKYATNPVATITAKNAIGVVMQNYTSASGLFKISPGNATYGITPSYAEASQVLTVLNSAVPVAVDTGSGVSTLTFADTTSNILGITRPASPINVFAANIALSFTLQDTDGVTVGNVNGVATSNPVQFGSATSGNGISFTGNYNTQVWGRLSMSNINGSELVALTVPVFTEYYNGSAFVPNTSDNCTALSLASQILLSNPSTSNGNSQAGTATMTIGAGSSNTSLVNTILSSGVSGISFSAPGAGNTGYINVTSNISSTLVWLLYPWNQAGTGNSSPSAVATFGVYQGNPHVIYFREVY